MYDRSCAFCRYLKATFCFLFTLAAPECLPAYTYLSLGLMAALHNGSWSLVSPSFSPCSLTSLSPCFLALLSSTSPPPPAMSPLTHPGWTPPSPAPPAKTHCLPCLHPWDADFLLCEWPQQLPLTVAVPDTLAPRHTLHVHNNTNPRLCFLLQKFSSAPAATSLRKHL